MSRNAIILSIAETQCQRATKMQVKSANNKIMRLTRCCRHNSWCRQRRLDSVAQTRSAKCNNVYGSRHKLTTHKIGSGLTITI